LPIRILHIHSTFSLGGKEARAVRLMNAFGDRARHSVISAMPGALSARDAIDPAIAVDFPEDHPPVIGKPGVLRYRALARYMRGFDLVLTYNWGAMDAVGARRLFGGPPLVHHEDGFNQEEATGQKAARVWFRHLTLGAAYAVVVPSVTLERIALTSWRQPKDRVHRIANGIALERYGADSGDTSKELIVGTVAGLRAIKNLPRLVRAFAASGIEGRLRIVGEGPEKATIGEEAARTGVSGRLDMPGFHPDPAAFLHEFAFFALSSDSEQQPISLIEAMAAGLPAVATDVGDVREMVAPENLPFIVPVNREDLLADAIARLAADPALRHAIGAANRAKALQIFDEKQMIGQYRALYADAVGQQGALG
jgi:L-malate glycosyltransferase